MTLTDLQDILLTIKSHDSQAKPVLGFSDDEDPELEIILIVDEMFIFTDLWKELQSFCMRIETNTGILHIGGRLQSVLMCHHDVCRDGQCVNCGEFFKEVPCVGEG